MTRRRLLAALVSAPDECRAEGSESLGPSADPRPAGFAPLRVRISK